MLSMESKTGLFIVYSLSVVTHARTLNCTTTTASCPSTKTEWDKREKIFKCGNQRYTCIMTNEKILVEACMWNSKIMSGTVGCPYIAYCDAEYGPILISEEKYFPCPDTLDGCPKSSHGGYSVSDMYKFPMCWASEKTTKFQTTQRSLQPQLLSPTPLVNQETQSDDKQSYSELPIIFGLVISVVIIFPAIAVVLFIFNRYLSSNNGKREYFKTRSTNDRDAV